MQRAACLINSRASGANLRNQTQHELINLIGIYPTPKQAKTWKTSFRKAIKEITKRSKSKGIQNRHDEPCVITEADYMNRIGLGHLNYFGMFSPDILSD